MVTDMGCRIQAVTSLNSCTHRHAASFHIKVHQSIKPKTWLRLGFALGAHLHVLIRNFIVCPGVRGSTTGGCGPPRIREGKGNVTALVRGLAATSDSQRCHSQEGMPHSVTDVRYGFHVHAVIMQRLGVCCRTCFCQEDTKPPSKVFRAARLKGRNAKTEFLFS